MDQAVVLRQKGKITCWLQPVEWVLSCEGAKTSMVYCNKRQHEAVQQSNKHSGCSIMTPWQPSTIQWHQSRITLQRWYYRKLFTYMGVMNKKQKKKSIMNILQYILYNIILYNILTHYFLTVCRWISYLSCIVTNTPSLMAMVKHLTMLLSYSTKWCMLWKAIVVKKL